MCGIWGKKKLSYREYTGGCQRGRGWEWMKWVKGVKMYKLPVDKISPGDLMYSMATIDNNTILHV